MKTSNSEEGNREINPGERVRGSMIFMPISLGNHFYSNKILSLLISEFVCRSDKAVIIVCDRLRSLSYQIRGEFTSAQIASNVRLQVEQMMRTLEKIGLNFHSNAHVTDWSFVKGDPRFYTTVLGLRKLVEEDLTVRELAQRHVKQLLSRFQRFSGPALGRAIDLQCQYLIEETALSVYMTEIRGFYLEVYRRGLGFVDDLYVNKPVELLSLTGKTSLNREFISIESYLEQRNLSAEEMARLAQQAQRAKEK